ncbi:MAG TPA: hypothetical protein VK843_19260 [Planctomycetota bacterium]|nr:hypothetical protein [Planctomycetota bacterium]
MNEARECGHCQRSYLGDDWLCGACVVRARIGLFFKGVLALLLAIGMVGFAFWLVFGGGFSGSDWPE